MKSKLIGFIIFASIISSFSAFGMDSEAAKVCAKNADFAKLEQEFGGTVLLARKLLNEDGLAIVGNKLETIEGESKNCKELAVNASLYLKQVQKGLEQLEASLK